MVFDLNGVWDFRLFDKGEEYRGQDCRTELGKGKGDMGIAVLDIGTSSMRGILYSETGEKLFLRQISYSPIYMEHNRVEQAPSDWKTAMEQVMKACAEYGKAHGESIECVSLTSQRSSLIPVDGDGNPMGRAIMWQDKRCREIWDELEPSKEKIFILTGCRINPVFSGPKMLWFRRFHPDLYEKAARLVVIPDFILHEMTGSWATDATYGSRSLLMNLRTREWDEELLKLFHIDRDKLCPILEPGTIAGHVSKECGERTGLPEGIPVVSAGGDQQCAALGLGVVSGGSVEVSAGTGAFIMAVCSKVPDDLKENIICNVSAIPGQYILESSILSCASVFNWFMRLCYGMNENNREDVYQTVNREIELSLKKGEGAVVLPLFQGRGTPDWNSRAKGSFHNLTMETERGDIGRAILEGLAFEIAVNMDVIKGYAGEPGEIHACGGLLNSPVFCRILSAAIGRAVRSYSDNEATAIGAWMSGAVALGAYPDHKAAFAQVRKGHPAREIRAEEKLAEQYARGKEQYCRLYERLYG